MLQRSHEKRSHVVSHRLGRGQRGFNRHSSHTVRITELWTYPVKSCRGVQLQSAQLTRRGVFGDRMYIVAIPALRQKGRSKNEKENEMLQITQRSHPSMARIIPNLIGTTLHLVFESQNGSSKNGVEVKVDDAEEPSEIVRYVDVWGTAVKCIDQGDTVAASLAEFLELPGARLLRMAKAKRHLDPAYLCEGLESSLADEFPLLLTSQDSLDEMNRHRACKQEALVHMDRFRPNLVVKGAHPFEEDSWHMLRPKLSGNATSDVHVRCVKPCARCSVPNVEQQSGIVHKNDVTRTLREMRSGPQCAEAMRRFMHQVGIQSGSQMALQIFEEDPSCTFFGVHAFAAMSEAAMDIDAVDASLHVGEELVIDYGCR